jgi:signal transduction histidine kinase
LELVKKMLDWYNRKVRLSGLNRRNKNGVPLPRLHYHPQSEEQLERLQSEIESLQTQLRQERALRAARENFTAMIAHEFGTPLSIIRAKSSLFSANPDRFSKMQIAQHFQNIEVQINYMVNLLDDLLFINRSNSTQSICQRETIELIPFCNVILEQIANQWERHEVVFTTGNNVKTAMLDRRVVHFTLSNLLSNAFKYSPAGREIWLDVQDDGQHTIFSVTDQGMGIPDAELSEIFTPFYRASNAHKFSGMGIGLAVVKTTVEACGGSVRVESKLGDGTTFIVSLPHQNS